MKIKGYTRSDGVKVPSHTRKGKSAGKRSYTPAQRRALEKSKTSKSGHKTYKDRIADEKQGKGRAGLWAHVHQKRERQRKAGR